jgi:hypothetical protein
VRLADLSDHVKQVDRPNRFGNPFRATEQTPEAAAAAVEQYVAYLRSRPHLVRTIREELRGLDVACSCPADLPCHGDVLLRVAAGGAP